MDNLKLIVSKKIIFFATAFVCLISFLGCKTNSNTKSNSDENVDTRITTNLAQTKNESSDVSFVCDTKREKIMKIINELGDLSEEKEKKGLSDEIYEQKIHKTVEKIGAESHDIYTFAIISRAFATCSNGGVYEIAFWKSVRLLASKKNDETAKLKLELLKERSGVQGADLGEFEAIIKRESFP